MYTGLMLPDTLKYDADESLYVWVPNGAPTWVPLKQDHQVKLSTCPKCGGSLPLAHVDNSGMCECSYCNTFSYVW